MFLAPSRLRALPLALSALRSPLSPLPFSLSPLTSMLFVLGSQQPSQLTRRGNTAAAMPSAREAGARYIMQCVGTYLRPYVLSALSCAPAPSDTCIITLSFVFRRSARACVRGTPATFLSPPGTPSAPSLLQLPLSFPFCCFSVSARAC